jgi:hypothetical protein
VRDNGYGLTIQVNPMVKGLFLCLALDPMVIFVTDTPCLNVGHSYGYTSSVYHLRSDSVELLVRDDSVYIRANGFVLQVI